MWNRARLVSIIFVTIVLLLLSARLVGADNTPTDVPTSHWAYKAVKLLIDKGYLQLYQDQTFQGDKPVDRYTLAVIVAKIMNEIASGQTGTSKEDIALIKSLSNEFRDELVGVSSKSNLFMKKMDEVLKEQKIIKEDLTRTNDEQGKLREEVQKMIADIQSLKDQNTKLKADLERLRADLESSKKQQTLYMIVAIVLGLYGAAK